MAVAILQCYSITGDVLVVYIVYTVLLIYNMVTFALQVGERSQLGSSVSRCPHIKRNRGCKGVT